MISVEEALPRLLAPLEPLPPSRCRSPTRSAACSPRMSPPAARSRLSRSRRWTAMRCAPSDVADGAGRAAHRRRGAGRRPASAAHVGAGEAARIFTGAPMPAGADTIVIQEDTERDGDTCPVLEGAARGRYVRRAGLDFREGDVLLRAGRRLTARDIGLAAAMNRPWLLVHRRPRVAHPVDRRRDRHAGRPDRAAPDRQLERPGARRLCRGLRRRCRCRSATPPTTPTALQRIAAGGARRRSAGDDRRRFGRRARSGARACSAPTGSSSISGRSRCGPGKPLMVGRYRGTPMVGLPGNPVSTLVCALLFLQAGARPAARPPTAPRRRAAARLGDERCQERPAPGLSARRGWRGPPTARSKCVPFERAGQLDDAPLARSDCLVVRPPHAAAAAAGDSVQIIPLDGSDFLARRGRSPPAGLSAQYPRNCRLTSRANQTRTSQGFGFVPEFKRWIRAFRGGRHADQQAARACWCSSIVGYGGRRLALVRGDEGGARPQIEIRHPPPDQRARGARLHPPPAASRPRPRSGAGCPRTAPSPAARPSRRARPLLATVIRGDFKAALPGAPRSPHDGEAVQLPLYGRIAAGTPIEALRDQSNTRRRARPACSAAASITRSKSPATA